MAAALKNFANDDDLEKYIRQASPSIRTAGREVVEELKSGCDQEGDFWFEVEFFVKIMEPVYALLRMADGTHLARQSSSTAP